MNTATAPSTRQTFAINKVPVLQEQKERLERDITGADFSSFDLGKASRLCTVIFYPDFLKLYLCSL
jgi:hypothetical protein